MNTDTINLAQALIAQAIALAAAALNAWLYLRQQRDERRRETERRTEAEARKHSTTRFEFTIRIGRRR